MFECNNNICVPCKRLGFAHKFWNYFVDVCDCVFNDDTSVLYIVFMSTSMSDVVGRDGCKVSMQLIAICLSCAVVFMLIYDYI